MDKTLVSAMNRLKRDGVVLEFRETKTGDHSFVIYSKNWRTKIGANDLGFSPEEQVPIRFQKSGFGLLVIVIAIAALIFLAAGGYFAYQRFAKPADIGGVACTQEAKLCPDGSYVSRTGPNCEFAKCPAPTPPQKSEIDISTWKTYRHEKYGLEMRYPSNFELFESEREIKIYRADPAGKIDVSMSISVEEKDAETALRDFVSSLSTGRDVSFLQEFFVSSSIKIGGRWGTKIEARVVGIPPTIFVPKDSDHSFLISFSRWYLGDTEEEITSSSAVVDQILSTFNFIE